MTTVFFIFVILVIAHFIVEGIIAPSERAKIRTNLFDLRDQVRSIKINDNSDEFADELFKHMQIQINKSIYLLHNYSVVGLFKALKAKEDTSIHERVEHFFSLLYEAKDPRIFKIYLRYIFYTFKGLMINSLGWGIYLFPPVTLGIAVFYIQKKLLFSKRLKLAKDNCVRGVSFILEIPYGLFERFFPPIRRV